LTEAQQTARKTYDPVAHKMYVADSGAAVVMEAQTGRVIAMAGQPTYNPEDWVGGISEKEYMRLNSHKAGDVLLPRATEGQFPPGSTWKPFMTTAALSNGYKPSTQLECSPGLQVGNRWFKNYEGETYGSITFAKALQLSCDTFFYRVGVNYWHKYGANPTNVHAKDPLVSTAESWGFGKKTGIDIPGEASGRVADRQWKLDYWNEMKGYYCKMDKKGTAKTPFLKLYAHEFCLQGNYYRLGDAVNFSIGQGDTMVTPIQLARAYSAMSNGGTLYEPTIGKAIVSSDGTVLENIKPKVVGHPKVTKKSIDYVNDALLGTPKTGTLAWKFNGFPLDQVKVRGKTGSAEVEGKQPTTWVATYNKKYVVIMMVTQGGTGSGTVGPYVRKVWEDLYGIKPNTTEIDPSKTSLPGGTPPAALPKFGDDGSILPPPGTKPAAAKPTTGKKSGGKG
ncbi:MAG: penicillin-binding protein 2, partial [Nocardioides sp.]|nr:penicillin-binding protein 2 [Nocardioides sp.]